MKPPISITVPLLCLTMITGRAASAEPLVDRGAYLVNAAAGCAGCHTPKTPTGFGPTLSGGQQFGSGPTSVIAPNITPDQATGIGAWSDRQMVDAIRLGVRPNGTRIGPPMPQLAYRAMREDDARAIVAYLRSVPAITHLVPGSRRIVTGPAPNVAPPAVLTTPSDAVAKGRYLANALAHCTECHTPGPPLAPDFATHLDAGGRIFHTARGTVVAPSITAASLRPWSDADLVRVVMQGERPDGSMLEGPMPVASYAKMTKDDVEALIAFLRAESPVSATREAP